MENIELERQVKQFLGQAGGYRAIDQGSLARASMLLLDAKKLEEKIKDFFSPLKAKAYASWRQISNAEDRELFKLKPVIDALSRSIASYKEKEERKRREAALDRAEQEKKCLEEEAL